MKYIVFTVSCNNVSLQKYTNLYLWMQRESKTIQTVDETILSKRKEYFTFLLDFTSVVRFPSHKVFIFIISVRVM